MYCSERVAPGKLVAFGGPIRLRHDEFMRQHTMLFVDFESSGLSVGGG